jgi:hypothetical protein
VRSQQFRNLDTPALTALAVFGGFILPLQAYASDPSSVVYGFSAGLMLTATALSRIHRVVSIIVFSILSLPLALVVFESLRALGGSNTLGALMFLISAALYGASACQMFFKEDHAPQSQSQSQSN